MSLFIITADQAREISKAAKPLELELCLALDDAYSIITGDAKRGQKTSVQRVFGDREKIVNEIKVKLEEGGFAVALHKDEKSTILSVSWL
jgi:hypothetical protein